MTQKSAPAQGAETLAQQARPRVVAVTLMRHMPVFPPLFGVPWAVALAEGEGRLALALGLPVAATLALALLGLRLPLPRDLRRVEAMAVLALLFLLAAVLAVPAFMALGMAPLDALFEGMSGITTTGLSLAPSPERWPVAAHVLRAWMQWGGGLAMATAALALILDPGLPARQLGRVGIEESDLLSSSRAQARQLLGAYVALTAFGAVGAALLLPSVWEGIVLALAAVSTGGFAPRADSLASYSAAAQGYLVLLSVCGAVSLPVFVLAGREGPRAAWDVGSLQRVGIAVALFAAIYAAAVLASGWVAPGAHYGRLLDLVSGLATAGFATGPMPVAPGLLMIIAAAMLVGGDVGSTGGGLKITRIVLLGQAVLYTLRRVRLPETAVYVLKSGGRKVEPESLVALLALVVLYLASLAAIWGLFLGYGYAPVPALFETVSALSTVGLSTGLVGPDLPAALKLGLTFGMWLGRLEFVAVLVMLLPGTWLGRR
jgi:trk system potassium uptake protein TrkH